MNRRPERDLDVVWQRHVPQGTGDLTTIDGETTRIDAVTDLSLNVERALGESYGLLDRGDLVVTISVRPPQGSEWCPVCKHYHSDPGVKTDAGALVSKCPKLDPNDSRNRYENFPVFTRADRACYPHLVGMKDGES